MQLVALQEVVAENELCVPSWAVPSEVAVPGANVEAGAGREPDNLIRALLISTGEDGGLLPMPVIYRAGPGGARVEVAPHSAQVLLIDDPRSAVAALSSAPATGIVKGTGRKRHHGADRPRRRRSGWRHCAPRLGRCVPQGHRHRPVSETSTATLPCSRRRSSPLGDLSDLEVVLVVTDHDPAVSLEGAGG